jgi:hypothetical protein
MTDFICDWGKAPILITSVDFIKRRVNPIHRNVYGMCATNAANRVLLRTNKHVYVVSCKHHDQFIASVRSLLAHK